MKKILFLILGFITLILGIIGVFLPVLPTTPFLLLSATCFLKSSEKLYLWLVNHKILGLYVKSYIEYRAITSRAKIISIFTLWLFILISVIFFLEILWMRVLLLFIAICVTIYLLRMKRLTKEMIINNELNVVEN